MNHVFADTSMSSWTFDERHRPGVSFSRQPKDSSRYKLKRRETFHTQQRRAGSLLPVGTPVSSRFEVAEIIKPPTSNLSVPRIISPKNSNLYGSTKRHLQKSASHENDAQPEPAKFLLAVHAPVCPPLKSSKLSVDSSSSSSGAERRHLPSISTSKASYYDDKSSVARTSGVPATTCSSAPRRANGGRVGRFARAEMPGWSSPVVQLDTRCAPETELDVQSVINERRPSKFKSANHAVQSSIVVSSEPSEAADTTGTSVTAAPGGDERKLDETGLDRTCYMTDAGSDQPSELAPLLSKDENEETNRDDTAVSHVPQIVVSPTDGANGNEDFAESDNLLDSHVSLEYVDESVDESAKLEAAGARHHDSGKTSEALPASSAKSSTHSTPRPSSSDDTP